MSVMLIRRSPTHSVVAHFETDSDGFITLTRLTPDKGDVPPYADILDVRFTDIRALRTTVLTRLRNHAKQLPLRTTLDRVGITMRVLTKWRAMSDQLVTSRPDLLPSDIEDEQVEKLPDGSLHLFARYRGEIIMEMKIPQNEWCWIDH